MELHHFAFKIRPHKLEKAIELFKELGMVLSYREGGARWALVEFVDKKIEIQLIEVDEEVLDLEQKLETHVAFISQKPKNEINRIKKWSDKNEIELETGGWNEEMLWFDAPDIFVNFVVEIMDYSVVGQ